MRNRGGAGAWDDRSQGYPQDDYYGQPGYEQPGYEPYGGPPGPAGREDYGRQDDYGYGYEPGGYERGPAPSPGYGDPAGYREPPAYGQPGYDQGNYEQGNYEQRPAPGYGDGYDRSGGYPAQRGGSGANPALRGGSGAYPAQDAGNDWYGGQPAAANGASFADTGTYALNGRIIDEYGTGPRGALRDPVHGYAPGPGIEGPGSGNTTASGPGAPARSGQQERYDDYAPYPGYAQEQPGRGRGAPDGYPGAGPGEYDDYASDRGYPDPSYNSTAHGTTGFEEQGQPQPRYGGDRDGYDGYGPASGPEPANDPYQERYGTGPRPAGSSRRPSAKGRPASPAARGLPLSRRMLYAVLAVVVAGVACAAAYVFVLKPKPANANKGAAGPLPTSSADASQAACAKELGPYCHISDRTDDPAPLTAAMLFPPAFTNEADKTSYSLATTKVDKKCSDAVIGPDLISALSKGKCTQVLRASYIAGNGKIMGTIGVINLATTNEAHYAGRVVGASDFIKPLNASKGPASKMDKGTGLVESRYKGHYLILTWDLFANQSKPSTAAERKQLEQFSEELIAGTANITLSQRMVTGAPASPAPSASATPSAKASATSTSSASPSPSAG
jgi:hypothetical protein